jgi:hypothetical protein
LKRFQAKSNDMSHFHLTLQKRTAPPDTHPRPIFPTTDKTNNMAPNDNTPPAADALALEESAVKKLVDGYKRFKTHDLGVLKDTMKHLSNEGQAPCAMVLSCCDSRAVSEAAVEVLVLEAVKAEDEAAMPTHHLSRRPPPKRAVLVARLFVRLCRRCFFFLLHPSEKKSKSKENNVCVCVCACVCSCFDVREERRRLLSALRLGPRYHLRHRARRHVRDAQRGEHVPQVRRARRRPPRQGCTNCYFTTNIFCYLMQHGNRMNSYKLKNAADPP